MSLQTKLIVCVIAGLVLLFVAVLDTGYRSRVQLGQALTASQRRGCLRGLADRHDNAEAWYAAYLAREHEALKVDKQGSVTQKDDLASAAIYLTSAKQLNSRTYGAYSVTFPPNAKAQPLGKGHLDCRKAFPEPHVSFFGGLL